MAPLPPSLLDLYCSYKDSTNYALAWIWLNCRTSAAVPAEDSFKNTAEIIDAAKRVQDQKKEVPQSVLTALSDAIKNRKKVLEIFRGLEVSATSKNDANSDQKHAIFIERLTNVFDILLPLRAANATNPPAPRDEARMLHTINRFESLELLQDIEPAESDVVVGNGPSEPPKAQKQPEIAPKDEARYVYEFLDNHDLVHVLEDDDIGEWLELTFFIYEWDSICKFANDSWVEAAESKISILMAAWVTNMAFIQASAVVERRVRRVAKTYDELVEKWMFHKDKDITITFQDEEGLLDQGNGRFANVQGLCHPGEVLQYRRTKGKYKNVRPEAADRRDPASIIQPPWAWKQAKEDADIVHDDMAFDMFQESTRHLLEKGRAISELESFRGGKWVCEPLIKLWKKSLDEPEEPLSARLVFGLEMLLSTFKSFLWPDVTTNKTNCRIAALRFAHDVKASLVQTLDVLLLDTGDHNKRKDHKARLKSMIAMLDKFCREKRFDLYYQAPWTAGCHMLEFHCLAFNEGVVVCTQYGYLSATLHMYNALRHVGASPIKPIPILEFLCEIFKERLFFNVFPKKNFSTHFRRAEGCGIEKRKDFKGAYYSGLRDPFSRECYRKDPMNPERLSLFHTGHMWNFRPKRWRFWVEIYGKPGSGKPSMREGKRIEKQINAEPSAVLLETTKKKVVPEVEGEKGVARFNFLAAFCLCARIMGRMGEEFPKFTRSNIDLNVKGPALGLAYVDSILDDITAQLYDEQTEKHIDEFRGLVESKNIFENLQEDLEIKDYMWSF
ncbi:hypothetical protein CkaCkLH20_10583 [Colletotrichum karsti]|uniref:DUF6604 domain-containing protein n=1 Tax=Colletotrichum karsti TaxID=1095194 RepID=A0A9P6LG94_9PEZI|nr:uncharacterized protein CkaCkLH20_10583 [Colletotrichum karsti]KAF9871951.1 hypothetical protein CkaCkLH20_10583 [Colletotrichum karsti]